MVESYLIVAAGFIFVGFGGSRWTAPYVERYIGLGVATGVKIMLLYLLIGTGMNLSVDWMTDAQKIASNSSPAMSALEIMGASIIFMMLCWQIPKLFAAVLGGSPALSGGDLVATGAFIGGGAIALGTLGTNAVSGAVGATGLLSSSTAGGSNGSATSSLGMLSSMGSASGGSGTVPPPTASASPAGSSQPSAPLTDAGKNLSDMSRRVSSQLPPDSAPHATPPRMNLDHPE
jgi:type IV secretion system protein TrbL